MGPETVDDAVVGPLALDATPLLGPRTGVGRYVAALVDGLAAHPRTPSVGLVTVSARRGAGSLRPAAGSWPRSLRLPAALWSRSLERGHPGVDLALRPARLWHMTNFVGPRPRRLPYTVTVHDLAYLHLPAHVNAGAAALRRRVPLALRGAAAVLTNSEATAADVRDAYPWLDVPVVPAPLGVDPSWFADADPGADPGRGPGAPFVVVGTREPRKNLGVLLRAHRAARAADPALPRLLVVGARGWGTDLDGEAADPAHARLVEDADDATLRRLVGSARALCAPSLREGFSLPVLEAMASGTPVLASDVPAHRELLGGTGTLVPVSDVDAWAGALATPAADLARLAAAARRRARTYTWARTTAVHVDVWSAVLGGGPP